jgi:P-type Ca2+ transporter type 2C
MNSLSGPTVPPRDEPAWHALTVAQLREQLGTDTDRGLASAEAQRRLAQYGPNELVVATGRTAWAILLHQFKSLIVLLLVAAAAIAVVLGDVAEALAIAIVIVLNAAIGFFVEHKAERTLAALREHAVPTAHVVRDGHEHEIPARALVPGDVVVLDAGARVPADGRIVHAVQLKVEEAALTGESHTVTKTTDPVTDEAAPLGDRIDMTYLGTAITDGRARMVVTATGARTELGKIGALVSSAVAEATPLEKRLARLGNALIGVVGVLALVIVGSGLLRGHAWLHMLEVGVSLAIAAMPEGLLAVSTMTLALGMQRMAKMGALIRRLPAVETLGSITVICTDKTGTLTENQMTVRTFLVDGRRVEVGGTGYAAAGEFRVEGQTIDASADPVLAVALRIGALCNDSSIERVQGREIVLGDPTEAALGVAAEKAGLEHAALIRDFPRVAERPFDSDRKRMATVHELPQGGRAVYVKGSPGAMLEMCRARLTASGTVPMTAEDRRGLLEDNVALAGAAMRVLALAVRELPEGPLPEDLERELTFVGFVGMEDPLRASAKTAIATCREAGIRAVMITGDQPATASEIARQLGIDRTPDGRALAAVHGRELAALDGAKWRELVARTAVFARVSPEQKLRIVETLQGDAQVVAMTGDGVNDAPALKKADIGIAMGGRGTEVAKEAAAMVITDDDFSTIVRAVEQGRIIYANILGFVRYLFACNAAEILVVFVAIMLGWPLPLAPLQILWMNVVTDVFPALALAVEPSAAGTMQQPPRDPHQSLVTRATAWLVVWQGLVLAAVSLVAFAVGRVRHGDTSEGQLVASTMAFMAIALAQVFHAFNARSQRRSAFDGMFENRWLWAAVATCLILQLAAVYVPPLQRVLPTAPPDAVDWLVIVACALAPVAVVELVKRVQRAA